MQAAPEQTDRDVLTASRWIATPADYASSRWLRFGADGTGEAVFGYGQTIYAKVLLAFEVPTAGTLAVTYLPSPAFGRMPAFAPAVGSGARLITYTLGGTTYSGSVSVIARPFRSQWLLTFAESPWPIDMSFPRPVPLEFYGGIEFAKSPWRGPGAGRRNGDGSSF
jgi:hypothetical protein